MKAVWNNQVIAESNDTIVVENNHYFPKESVNAEYLCNPAPTHTTCPWKGLCLVLYAGGGWPAKPRCGLVLPRSETCRRKHYGPRGVLERC